MVTVLDGDPRLFRPRLRDLDPEQVAQIRLRICFRPGDPGILVCFRYVDTMG